MSDKQITTILSDISKTADLAENFDLALILGVIAKARRQGKERDLAETVAAWAVDKKVVSRVQVI